MLMLALAVVASALTFTVRERLIAQPSLSPM
jgi:hypothetical protein